MTDYYQDFTSWVRKQPATSHFLVVLTPFIQGMLQKLEKKRMHYHMISRIFSKAALQLHLYQEIQHYWIQKIIRAAVVELHALRAKEMLLADTAESRFEYFIHCLSLPENSGQFFEKYSVLKSQFLLYEKQYIQSLELLFDRIEKNWDLLVNNFFPNQDSTKTISLKEIKRSGDIHAGGQAVAILTFLTDDNPVKIVYKPRSLEIDQVFYRAVCWLNQHITLPLYNPFILSPETDYGFYEFIVTQPALSPNQLGLYYQRLGSLTALLHAFLGCDIHAENVIAAGEHPVIIDLECLLQPQITKAYRSIMDIGILPKQFFTTKTFAGIDVSVLGRKPGQALMQTLLRPERSGFDDMTIQRVEGSLKVLDELPTLPEDPNHLTSAFSAFIFGFSESFDAISKHRDYLMKHIQVFLRNTTTRLVFRPTYEYSKLLLESYHPSLLTSETIYKKHFDWLLTNGSPIQKTLAAYEKNELFTGNFPLFLHNTNDSTIIDSNKNLVPVNIIQNALDRWLTHIKTEFHPSKKKFHLTLIDQSFCSHQLNHQKQPFLIKNKIIHSQPKTTSLRIQQQIDLLLDEHIHFLHNDQNTLTWPTLRKNHQHWEINWIKGPGIYQDLLGIMICFAHLYHYYPLTPCQMKTLDPLLMNMLPLLLKELNDNPPSHIGWFNGWGGVIYGLNQLAQFYPKKIFPTDWINQFAETIDKTQEVDLNGLMGGLLALSSFNKPNTKIKQLMKHIFNRFIELYPTVENKPFSTSIASDQPLVGYAHGTSGMMVALSTYANLFHDPCAKKWIRAALKYERALFSKEHNNWPDLRKQSLMNKNEFSMTAWCHGASGITLSRMQLYRTGWRDSVILQEIRTGLKSILRTGFTGTMNLCHGDLGNLDILLYATQHGFLPHSTYEKKLSDTLDHLHHSALSTDPGVSAFTAGLMTGRTGIIYQLLRCWMPEMIPSVLAMDF